MERDSKEDINKTSRKDKNVYLKRFVKAINGLGVTFNIWEKKNADGGGSSIHDWTSLLGSDKRKLMNNLPAQLEQNDILIPERKGTVIKIWKDFNDL